MLLIRGQARRSQRNGRGLPSPHRWKDEPGISSVRNPGGKLRRMPSSKSRLGPRTYMPATLPAGAAVVGRQARSGRHGHRWCRLGDADTDETGKQVALALSSPQAGHGAYREREPVGGGGGSAWWASTAGGPARLELKVDGEEDYVFRCICSSSPEVLGNE